MAEDLIGIEVTIVWATGAVLSAVCLITQVVVYIYLPSCRKLDLKILTQITIARLVNVILEIIITKGVYLNFVLKCVIYLLYIQTDCALLCWMFIFSKNLYNKLIQVFTIKKFTFLIKSMMVFALTLLVGVTGATLIAFVPDYFHIFFVSYSIIKFVVLFINMLFFCRIFYVAIKRNVAGTKRVVRTCVVFFLLISISGLQVLLTDLLSYFEELPALFIFSVLNSYQALVVMMIFVNLVRGFTMEAGRKISRTVVSSSTA